MKNKSFLFKISFSSMEPSVTEAVLKSFKRVFHVAAVFFWVIEIECNSQNKFSCSGKVPGYYADLSSSCSSYLLCMGTSRTRGMLFSCPPGTKFQQRTLVCDHAYAVDCLDSENYFSNNLRIGKKNVKFIDQAVADEKDSLERPLNTEFNSLRNKREKHPLSINNEDIHSRSFNSGLLKKQKRKNALIMSNEDLANLTSKISKNKKRKNSRVSNAHKSKNIFRKLGNNHFVKTSTMKGNLDISIDCIFKSTCKLYNSIKQEKNKKFTESDDSTGSWNTNKLVEGDTKSEHNQSKLSDLRKTNIGFKEDPVQGETLKENPAIVLDSKRMKTNKSEQSSENILSSSEITGDVLKSTKIDKENNHQPKFTINSIRNGAFKHRTKSLDKIPFSRVVAVQSKLRNIFSPLINFSDLLESLTKTSQPVRMIPIAVNSEEAEYIRSVLNRRDEKHEDTSVQVEENKKETHDRHPRLIKQIYGYENFTKSVKLVIENEREEQSEKEKNMVQIEPSKRVNHEYQIIYKSQDKKGAHKFKKDQFHPSKVTLIEKDPTQTILNNSNESPSLNITEAEDSVIIVKPRGPSKGFFNRAKFEKLSKNSITAVKNKQLKSDQRGILSPTKLQFGFSPLHHSNISPLPLSKYPSVRLPSKQHSEKYLYDNIDTLQAPSYNELYHRADKRSPKYSTNVKVKKQDRKSHLDFLGIFDTRKYFFIPPNRRSEMKERGIFFRLVSLF